MKKYILLLILVSIIVTPIVFLYQSKHTGSVISKKKVAASIFPVYDIAKNIGGDKVEVVLILPPGASPHSYDPTPEGIKQLHGADTLFYIGHGIDDWSTNMADSADIRDQVTVDKNVQFIENTEEYHHEDEDHEHEEPTDGMDPHYWLNIKNGKGIALQIRDELSTLYPEDREVFNKNYARYKSELEKQHQELTSKVQALPNKNIATFHNAYGYFAQDFSLTIVTTFEEFPGEEPTPEYLQEFTSKIKDENVRVIFAEPQFSTRSLEPIASDLNVTISQLDPIGGVEGRDSFISLMNYNVNQVISAVSQ